MEKNNTNDETQEQKNELVANVIMQFIFTIQFTWMT